MRRIVPPRWAIPRTDSRVRLTHFVLAEQPREAALDSEDFPSAIERRQDRGANDRVEARRVTAARSRWRFSSLVRNIAHDLSRQRVPPELGLFEYRVPVPTHLEASAARRNQFDVRVRKCLSNLGRQPGGPRFVRSDRAVFDRVMVIGPMVCVIAMRSVLPVSARAVHDATCRGRASSAGAGVAEAVPVGDRVQCKRP